jgi:general transcription factor 3C polypeptide 6
MNAPSSLCPGYKQVEAFGPEGEYEDDEEVSYVVLDLGNVEPTLVPTSSTYKLIVSSTFLWGGYIF